MIVLAIETSAAATGVALGTPDGIIASTTFNHHRRHVETLVPTIDALCQTVAIRLTDISLIAVDVGPGQFAGLRIGYVAAKALGYANGIPLAGVSSLDAIALAASATDRRIIATVDALRDEVYFAEYAPSATGVDRVSDPLLIRVDALKKLLAERDADFLLAGAAGTKHKGAFEQLSRVRLAGRMHEFPSAAAVCELALLNALRSEPQDITPADILYLQGTYADAARIKA